MVNLDKSSLFDKSRFFLSVSDPSSVILFCASAADDCISTMRDFNKIFHDELIRFRIEFGLKDYRLEYNLPYQYCNCDCVYSSNEFPVSYIKLAYLSWQQHVLNNMSRLVTPSFIVGNHYIALTTDDRFKFYVPELKQGYENINDVLTALDAVINGDISHIKIIHTEYLDMTNLPATITCKGKIWSPYNEPGLDMTSTLNKKRFANLIKTRKEQRVAYIQDILKSLSRICTNRMMTCRDMHGSLHLINATEISTISVKEADTQEISAEITLRNRIAINVDLEEFAKAFVDHDSDQTFELIKSLYDEREMSIVIDQAEEDVYNTIWKESIKKYKIVRDEKKNKVSDRDDFNSWGDRWDSLLV